MSAITSTAPAKEVLCLHNTNCTPHELVMTFESNKPKFVYKRMEQELMRFGIDIPGGLEKNYSNLSKVGFPSSASTPEEYNRFKSAFCEVYVPLKLKGYVFTSATEIKSAAQL
jgi:hypothetical protein